MIVCVTNIPYILDPLNWTLSLLSLEARLYVHMRTSHPQISNYADCDGGRMLKMHYRNQQIYYQLVSVLCLK